MRAAKRYVTPSQIPIGERMYSLNAGFVNATAEQEGRAGEGQMAG